MGMPVSGTRATSMNKGLRCHLLARSRYVFEVEIMVRAINMSLNELFRRYHRDAVRFAARLLGNRDNGEEVVQDVWLNMTARSPATPIQHPKTYLFKATRNAAIDFTARQQREWAYRVDMDSLTEADNAFDPIADYARRHQLAELAVFLNELPESCRQAFVLHKFEGYSHPEVAERMGISVSMVEKHIMRALMHCRDLRREHNEA